MNRFPPRLAAGLLAATINALCIATAGAQPAPASTSTSTSTSAGAGSAAAQAATATAPSPAAAPQTPPPPPGPLLGIALAAPLDMPACPAALANTAPPAGKRCYVEETYRGEKRLRVNLPADELPSWASAVRVLTDARSGRVETIRIHTTGIRVQRPVMLTLIRQYGKPASTSAVKVQDSKGMALDSLLARWQTADAAVEFQSMTGETDDGLIIIRTPQAAQNAPRAAGAGPAR